jgi:drug/metabolite transporter (DMT)-like permease
MMVLDKSAQAFAVAVALLSAVFFGLSTPLSKMLILEANPFLLAGLLYLGAGLGLIPFGISGLKYELPIKSKSNFKYLIGIIVIGGILAPVFLLGAIKIASAASVSLWLNLELVATAFLGAFLFKDYLHKWGWLGVAISVIAGALLSFNDRTAGIFAGILVALACLCWGFDNHFSALIDNLSPVQSTIIKGLCAGATNLLIGLALSNWHIGMTLALKAMAVGFFCYGISIVLYITAAQKIGSVRGQIFFSTAPFWAVLFSMVLLKESLSAAQIISGLLLLVSVLLILKERHKHYHEHAETEHIHQHEHDDLHHNHHEKVEGAHSHCHKHEKLKHSHPHWPDLHHRHDHRILQGFK